MYFPASLKNNPLQVDEAHKANVSQEALTERAVVNGQRDADRQDLERYVAQQDQRAQSQQDDEEGGDGSLEVATRGQGHKGRHEEHQHVHKGYAHRSHQGS